MHILLDTNIFLSDPTYSKPEHEALKNYLRTSNGKILLTETVRNEVEKNIKKIAFNDVRKINQLTPARTGLIENVPSYESVAEKLQSLFETFIRSRHINIGHEHLNLTDLFNRSLEEKAPFKTEGRGFRDALIWGGLLYFLNDTDNAQIAFISNNTTDFGKDTLKPELAAELVSLGHVNKVFYFNSLNTFLATYGRSIEFINDDFIETVLESDMDSYSEDINEIDLDVDYPNREFEWSIEEVDYNSHEIDSYYIFSADTVNYWISVNVIFNFDVFLAGRTMDWKPTQSNDAMSWEVVETTESVHATAEHNWVIVVNKVTHEAQVIPF